MVSNNKLEINQSQEHAVAQARSGDSYRRLGEPDDEPAATASGWASLTPKLKRAIVIGVALGVVLLIALIVLIVVLTGNRCSFSSSPPIGLSPRTVYTVPDVTNMAKFAGYIHVYDLGFLALDIRRMTVRKLDSIITLEDDCVSLSVKWSKINGDNNGSSIYMYDLGWIFNDGPGDERKRKPYEKCTVSSPEFHHTFRDGYHYSCRERETHQCRKSGRDGQTTVVAEMVIESFELELGGDDEVIYRGDFSKPPYPGSCDSYMAQAAANSTDNNGVLPPRTNSEPAARISQ